MLTMWECWVPLNGESDLFVGNGVLLYKLLIRLMIKKTLAPHGGSLLAPSSGGCMYCNPSVDSYGCPLERKWGQIHKDLGVPLCLPHRSRDCEL